MREDVTSNHRQMSAGSDNAVKRKRAGEMRLASPFPSLRIALAERGEGALATLLPRRAKNERTAVSCGNRLQTRRHEGSYHSNQQYRHPNRQFRIDIYLHCGAPFVPRGSLASVRPSQVLLLKARRVPNCKGL